MAKYYIADTGDEEPRAYSVERDAEGLLRVLTPEGNELLVDAFVPHEGQLHLLADGDSVEVDVRERKDMMVVQLRGHTSYLSVLNERQMRMRAAGGAGSRAGGPDLESPMAGKVVALKCAAGDAVEEGQALVVVEAMKMENDLKAHKSGVISDIHVAVGQAVEIGDALVSISDD